MNPSSGGIKSNPKVKVKALAAVAMAISFFTLLCHADDPAPGAPATPGIEAKTYSVRVSRKSRSGRVYLLESSSEAPQLGRIVLLKQREGSIMAFRSLKTYPGKGQFAGKVVRRYPGWDALEPGTSFSAVEKISDLPVPPQTSQDKTDLKELESDLVPPAPAAESAETLAPETAPTPGPGAEPNSPDAASTADLAPVPEGSPLETDTKPTNPDEAAPEPENQAVAPTDTTGAGAEKTNDNTPPPTEAGNVDDDTVNTDDDDALMDSISAHEIEVLDRYKNWLSFEFGSLKTYDHSDQFVNYSGGGVRFGHDVAQRFLIFNPKVQDSLTLEMGLFYYSINGYASDSDAFTIVPLIATARYNLILQNGLGLFVYGGLLKNNVMSNKGTDEDGSRLSMFLPALGGGLLFQIGPNWNLRVDAGLDIVGAGVILRF